MASIVKDLIPASQTRETLVTATEDMSVQEALARMIDHDFSQLPVVDQEFKLKGLITSDSILTAVRCFNSTLGTLKVSHAMRSKAKFCREEDDLSELLNGLRDASAIPIVDNHKEQLIAIVTNYDTAEYYRQRAEDIMLAAEIETTLKDFIQSAYEDDEGNLDHEALKKAIEDITPSGKDFKNKFRKALCSYLGQSKQIPPQPDEQLIESSFMQNLYQATEVKRFEDLTLFEYTQLFKNLWDGQYKAVFNDLQWEAIQELLSNVRDTRNAIAHFREISSNQRNHLKFCAHLLDSHRSKSEEGTLLNEPVVNNTFLVPGRIFLAAPKDYRSSENIDIDSGSSLITSSEAPILAIDGVEREEEFIPVGEEVSSSESRYAPLAIWLQDRAREGHNRFSLTFEQIEEIINDKLPPSARQYRNWWANDSISHTQSQQWLDVDWRVASINISAERVVFSLMHDRQAKYISFFNELQSQLKSLNGLTVKPASNLQGQSWIALEVVSAEFSKPTWLNFAFARFRFRVEYYIDFGDQNKNKSVFDSLLNNKAEIEADLKESLSWERLNHRRASRIALYHAPASITQSPEELAKLQDWATQALVRFYKAIAPHLHKVLENQVLESHD
jgi:CBS domain-containing protein